MPTNDKLKLIGEILAGAQQQAFGELPPDDCIVMFVNNTPRGVYHCRIQCSGMLLTEMITALEIQKQELIQLLIADKQNQKESNPDSADWWKH